MTRFERPWGVAEWLASGLGLGRIPWMPGTFGTLPGVLLVAGVWPRLTGRLWASVAVALLLPLLGVALCGAAERQLGRKDDRRIIADEFLSFPLAMVGLPVGLDTWWVVVIAFFAFRFFDVLKPWPARACERLAGGWGVVLDDVVAALYALACTHGFYRTIMYYLF